MANEYYLGDQSVLLWAPEATPYTAETTIDNYFGIIEDEVELPNPNEQTMLPSIGHDRRPFVASPDPRAYEFSIPCKPVDGRVPLETCIGQRKKWDMQIGHQSISNSEAEFTGSESITNGTYHLNVNDDGNGVNDVSVTCAADDVDSMIVKLQVAIRAATGGSETVVREYGLIVVKSGTTGASSSIAMTDGAGDDGGLIAALSAISGVTASIDAARDGVASASFEYIFDDENKLSTMTIYGAIKELGMTQTFAGCKSSLGVSCSVGEAMEMNFDIAGVHHVLTTGVSAFQQPSSALPSQTPYRWWMVSDAQLDNVGGGTFKDLLAITGINLNWDNGLKVVHTRGNARSGVWSREGYCVTENENAGRYDMSIDITIDGTEEFQEAYDADTLYDFYIKFQRTYGDDTETVEFWLYSCAIGNVPVKMPAGGHFEGTVTLHPLDTRVRIVTASEISV